MLPLRVFIPLYGRGYNKKINKNLSEDMSGYWWMTADSLKTYFNVKIMCEEGVLMLPLCIAELLCMDLMIMMIS